MGSTSDSFYTVSGKFSPSALRGHAEKAAYMKMSVALAGKWTPDETAVITHDSGLLGQDFLWVSLVPIISNRVVQALSEAGATGWQTYPVQLRDKQGRSVDGYHGLAIVGKCDSARLDAEHSKVVFVEGAKGMFPHYKGLAVAGWEGSDIFMPRDGKSTHLLVTSRIARLFSRMKISNVELTPVANVELPATDHPGWGKIKTESSLPA